MPSLKRHLCPLFLLVIIPDSMSISNANAYIYTKYMAVGFHLPLSLFGFLSNHIPIYYLFTLIPKDYSNNIEEFLLGFLPREGFP